MLPHTEFFPPENTTEAAQAIGLSQQAILTPMVAQIDQAIQDKITAQIPVGRMGQPEEIGRTVVFLADEQAGYITGSNLSINGGQHMY